LSRKFPYTKECQNCYGTGQCQLCGGTGRVKQSRFEEFNMSMLDEKNSESSNDIELEEFGVSSNSESKSTL
jgi:DnaJ-class molecular chaperone